MDKIICGIVGLGRIGSILEEDGLREKPCTHAGAIAENKDCLLAAGCDISEKKCELFTRRWNCPNIYTDLGKMLEESRLDILHIATPTETHLEIIEAENIPVQLEIGSGRNYIVFELDLVFSAGGIKIGNGLYEEYVSERSPYYEKMNSLAKINAWRPSLWNFPNGGRAQRDCHLFSGPGIKTA